MYFSQFSHPYSQLHKCCWCTGLSLSTLCCVFYQFPSTECSWMEQSLQVKCLQLYREVDRSGTKVVALLSYVRWPNCWLLRSESDLYSRPAGALLGSRPGMVDAQLWLVQTRPTLEGYSQKLRYLLIFNSNNGIVQCFNRYMRCSSPQVHWTWQSKWNYSEDELNLNVLAP